MQTHQGSTTQQNHEDDECFKPVVLHNEVAGLAEVPPVLTPALGDGHVTALVAGNTSCKSQQFP